MSFVLKAFTLFHVAISLAGIVSGFAVLYAMIASKRMEGWTRVYLITTAATSLTGFLFPLHGFTPAIGVGILSIIILAVAAFARYAGEMDGPWRWVYVVSAMWAFYLNFFVLVAQSFDKIPPLHSISPTQNDPPFKITQMVVLLVFAGLTVVAVLRFKVPPNEETAAG